jgi:hypothetical protein
MTEETGTEQSTLSMVAVASLELGLEQARAGGHGGVRREGEAHTQHRK